MARDFSHFNSDAGRAGLRAIGRRAQDDDDDDGDWKEAFKKAGVPIEDPDRDGKKRGRR